MEPAEYRRMFEMEDEYWWFVAKRTLVRGLVDRYLAGPPALAVDVGCGTGGTLRAFSSMGGRWVGVERSELALGFCRKRGLRSLLQASAEALPLRAESADLLLCLDVLYHRGVEDDRAVLQECFRVLRPGGTAIITDSALEWLRGPHDEAVHARRRYRLDELAALVRASRLRVVRQSYTNALLFLPVAIYRLLRKGLRSKRSRSDLVVLPRPAQWVLSAMMAWERWVLRWIDLPLGTSLMVVATKP